MRYNSPFFRSRVTVAASDVASSDAAHSATGGRNSRTGSSSPGAGNGFHELPYASRGGSVRSLCMVLVSASALVLLAIGCGHKTAFGRRTYSKRTFESASDALAVVRENKEAWVRRAAFEYLGQPSHLGTGEADRKEILGILALALEAEQDAQTRVTILESIGRLDTERRLELVAPALDDQQPVVREVACRLAGRTGSPEAAAPLAKLLETDSSLDVRLAAADALGSIRSHESAAALASRIEDRDVAVRFRCQQSLKRLTGKSHGLKTADWEQEIETVSFEQPSTWDRWLGLIYTH